MFALPVIQMFTFFIDNKTDIVYCLISLFAESFAENVINKAFNKHAVVSFTGTWVETNKRNRSLFHKMSYPLRVRGLKLPVEDKKEIIKRSYPLRVRGLKP